MPLSSRARLVLETTFHDPVAAQEIADAIDLGMKPHEELKRASDEPEPPPVPDDPDPPTVRHRHLRK